MRLKNRLFHLKKRVIGLRAQATADDTAVLTAHVPPNTTMGHVHLHVGNLNHAKAFYLIARSGWSVVRSGVSALTANSDTLDPQS